MADTSGELNRLVTNAVVRGWLKIKDLAVSDLTFPFIPGYIDPATGQID